MASGPSVSFAGLPGYSVEGLLGLGSQGQVFLARRISDNKQFAIKWAICDKRGDLETCQTEASTLERLHHPGIVHIVESYQDTVSGTHSIITEYCAGGNIFAYVSAVHGGRLPELFAVNVTRGLLQVLHYMHKMDVIHHDIKPENILLRDDSLNNVVLADLGIAKLHASTISWRRNFRGTKKYMAPEILVLEDAAAEEALASYTRKADVWSLGVTIYVLLAGSLPYSDIEHVKSPRTGDIWRMLPIVGISKAFSDLLQEMLTTDPFLRPEAEILLRRPILAAFLTSDISADVLVTATPTEERMLQSSSQRTHVHMPITKEALAIAGGECVALPRQSTVMESKNAIFFVGGSLCIVSLALMFAWYGLQARRR